MPTHFLLDDLPGQARAVLRVSGDDAERFLQGLLTSDVAQLTVGSAQPSALLTVKGKIVSEVIVLAPNDAELWLVIPADLADEVLHQFEAHVIMDDVALERLPDGVAWASEAPSGTQAFATVHPAAGWLVVGPPARLRSLPGRAMSESEFTSMRIDQGRPAWGHEIVVDRFPSEVGFVDAVSYSKGCYLGQEPLSRIHNRGQVNRAMVRFGGAAAIGPLFDQDDPAGDVTSSLDHAGLAIVKRRYAIPGTKLRTQDGAEVVVESGPLGDDARPVGKSGTVALGRR